MDGRESPRFKKFVDICCMAYNVVRRNANTFISLFGMMLSTGIPELRSYEDIEYLRRAFSLDLRQEQASEYFTTLISTSLGTRSTSVRRYFYYFDF